MRIFVGSLFIVGGISVLPIFVFLAIQHHTQSQLVIRWAIAALVCFLIGAVIQRGVKMPKGYATVNLFALLGGIAGFVLALLTFDGTTSSVSDTEFRYRYKLFGYRYDSAVGNYELIFEEFILWGSLIVYCFVIGLALPCAILGMGIRRLVFPRSPIDLGTASKQNTGSPAA